MMGWNGKVFIFCFRYLMGFSSHAARIAKSVIKHLKLIHQCLHPWKLTWNPKMEVWKMIFLFDWVIFRWTMLSFQGVFIPLSLYFGVLQGFDVGGAVWLDDEAGDGWDLSQGALGNLDFTENLWRMKKIRINCYYFQLAGCWCISFGSFLRFIGQKSSSYPHWRDQTLQFCMVGHFEKKSCPSK